MKYRNFFELKKRNIENVDYAIIRRCLIAKNIPVIISIHGGKTEPYTEIIANGIAGDKFNYYAFLAIKKGLRIPSPNFDEPKCEEICKKSKFVVAIHGEKKKKEKYVYIGGRNNDLKDKIYKKLHDNEIKVKILESGHLAGLCEQNICNRYSDGIQLEITNGLRKDTYLREKLIESVKKVLIDALNTEFKK